MAFGGKLIGDDAERVWTIASVTTPSWDETES